MHFPVDTVYVTDEKGPLLSPQYPPKTPSESSSLFETQPTTSKVTLYLLFAIFVILLGSFQYGYNVSITNTPQEVIANTNRNATECETGEFWQPCVPMNRLQYTIFGTATLFGALVGALISSPAIELLGRKFGLITGNIFIVTGNFMIFLFSNFYVFVVGRTLVGLGVGFISVTVPAFISEISPKRHRGAFGAFHQLMIVTAIMFANLFAYFLSIRYHWRFLFLIPTLVGILQIILVIFIPESPNWLYGKGYVDRAEKNAISLRGRSFSKFTVYASDLKGIGHFLNSLRKLFRLIMIKPFLIGVLLHTGAQFSGVNAIIFYSTKIFKSAGIGNAGIVSVATGLMFVVSTFVGLLLLERLGRKVLFLLSTTLAGVSFIGLSTTMLIKNGVSGSNETAANFFAVLFVFSFITFYSIGLGPIPWLMLSEIYPSNLKSFYYGIITALGWICKLIVTFSFPFLFQEIGEYTFFIFSGYLFFAAFVGLFLIPETKGKSLEELTGHLQ